MTMGFVIVENGFFYLMKADIKGTESNLLAELYVGTWANSLLKLVKARLATTDEKVTRLDEDVVGRNCANVCPSPEEHCLKKLRAECERKFLS